MGRKRLRSRPMIIDCHTHLSRPDALVNIYPGQTVDPTLTYSCGIHPWHADTGNSTLKWQLLSEVIALPNVRAVGETGIDMLRGPSIEIQTAVFMRHIELSQQSDKPIVIHCVKAWQQIMQIHRHVAPSQPWIIHGFRGKPQLALQLIDQGFFISLGPLFNPSTAAVIPQSQLLIETDDTSDVTIQEVAAAVATARNLPDPSPLLKESIIWR